MIAWLWQYPHAHGHPCAKTVATSFPGQSTDDIGWMPASCNVSVTESFAPTIRWLRVRYARVERGRAFGSSVDCAVGLTRSLRLFLVREKLADRDPRRPAR